MSVNEDEMDKRKDLIIEPLDAANLTDEDSDAEDDLTIFHPESLSGNQLRAPAEFRASKHDSTDENENSNDDLDEEARTERQKIRRRKVTKTFETMKWVKQEHNIHHYFLKQTIVIWQVQRLCGS